MNHASFCEQKGHSLFSSIVFQCRFGFGIVFENELKYSFVGHVLL